MVNTSTKELKREKEFKEACRKYAMSMVDFDIASTEIGENSKYAYPKDLEKLLTEFDHDERHWIIYVKK